MIRRATAADAAELSAFAARTFRDTFGDDMGAEDMELFLAQTYSEAQQRDEIERGTTLLAMRDDVLAGFAQLATTDAPACVDGPSPVEIGRFYVDKAFHGRGVAHELMDAALAAARNMGGATVWLGVWEHNHRAMAFYAKFGFRDVGSHGFLVGTDLQTDRLMTRPL